MSKLEKTYFYLNKIINKEESFTSILNKLLANSKLSSDDVRYIRDALKATINKYYFVRYEILKKTNEVNMTLNDNEMNILVMCVSIFQYVKFISKNDVIIDLANDFNDFDFMHEFDDIKKLIDSIDETPIDIKGSFDDSIVKKISLTYSYPEWIVKMMIKHFGIKNTYKSIAASRRNHDLVINYNPMKVSSDDLNKNLFVKTKLTQTGFNYVGKDKIIDLKEFKNGEVFVEDETTQLLVENMDFKQGDDILIMDDQSSFFAIDTALRCNDFCNIKVACKDSLSLNNIKVLAKRFNISSIELFESDAKLLITHVEPRKMDKVVIIPPSSNLGCIRKHPDYLISLKREELDSLIENEYYILNEVERFVKDRGDLLYAVYTLNLKESQNIIEKFLKEHSEYVLLDQKQVFPYEGPSDGIYFAKLRKIK